MSMRTLKALSATTAFIAAASAANAATTLVEGTTYTSTTYTTGTDDIVNVSGSTVISATGNPAIIISNTAGSFSLNTSASTILRSDSVTGTIGLADDHNVTTGVTIHNSGSIINTLAGGAAISLTTANVDGNAASATIINTGTISGSINFSSAATGNSLTNNGGTISGAIEGSNGDETLNLNGGSYTGNINLRNGTNTVTVSGSTLNGNYTGGTGDDIITLVNGGVSGTMNFGTGTADRLYISGTTAFTTKGAITGLEVLGVSGTTANLNHAVTGTGGDMTNVVVSANGTLNINDTQGFGAAAISNNGVLNITSGTTTADTYAGTTGSNLGITITSNTNAGNSGKLVLTTGGADLSGTSLTISFRDAGFIASGTTFTLVDGANTSQLQGTLLASNTGVYRLSTELFNTNQDIRLVVGRVSTSSVVSSQSGKAIANVLDVLGSNASNTLNTVQGVIGAQTTAAGVDRVVESLAPGIDGIGAASVGVTQATGNQVSNRLASLRTRSVATGDAIGNDHLWIEGFGNTVSQDDKNGNKGYDANGGGFTVGMDTDTLLKGVTTGASLSYGRSTVDSNASSNASTDIDSYVGTLYGSTVLDQGVFVNGQLGLGYNNYQSERTVIGVGTAKADFDGFQGTAKVETGKDFAYQAYTFTPLAGVQYTYLNMDSYTETGAGGANLTVNPEDINALDLSLGGQAAYTMPLADGGTFKPSVHAKYIYAAGDTNLQTTSRFTGGGTAFNTTGVKADRSGVNLGAGLLLTTAAGADFSLNYDADIRDSLTGHAGQLKARWAF